MAYGNLLPDLATVQIEQEESPDEFGEIWGSNLPRLSYSTPTTALAYAHPL